MENGKVIEQDRKYGYFKEKLDFYQEGDIPDTFIDFTNNEKGIAVAIQCPNFSMQEIIQKIYNVYIKNKRKTDNK